MIIQRKSTGIVRFSKELTSNNNLFKKSQDRNILNSVLNAFSSSCLIEIEDDPNLLSIGVIGCNQIIIEISDSR